MSSGVTNANKAEDRQDDECVICLDEIKNRSTTDACMHYFCFACIQEWVKNSTSCPLCKRVMSEIRYDIDKDGENTYKSFPVTNFLAHVRRIRSSLDSLQQIISHLNSDTIRNAQQLLQEIKDFSRVTPIPDISKTDLDRMSVFVNVLEYQYDTLRRSEEILGSMINKCFEGIAFIDGFVQMLDRLEAGEETLSPADQEWMFDDSFMYTYLLCYSANSSEANRRLKDEKLRVIQCFSRIRTYADILADLQNNSGNPSSASNVSD